MELTTRLEEANTEMRNVKRQVTSLKRRLSQFTEEKKRSSQNLYAGMNMLTADQVAAGAAAAAAGASDDGSGNAMMVQNMMNSPRNMVSMVGTMPQLPMGVLRVGNGGGFGIQNGVNGGIGMMQGRMGQMQGLMQGGMQGMGGMGGMGGMQAGPSLWQQQNGGGGGGGGGPTIRTVVPETEADLSQGRRVSGRAKNDDGGGASGSGYSSIHSRDGGGKQQLSGSKPLRPSPKKSGVSNQSPQQRVETAMRCVVRDSNSGHQLLLPPANWCPIFASRTTQARRTLAGDKVQLNGGRAPAPHPARLRLQARCGADQALMERNFDETFQTQVYPSIRAEVSRAF